MARPGGYFRAPVRSAPKPRRRPVRPRPEVSVQSRPQSAQRPAQHVRTNLRNPLAPLPFQGHSTPVQQDAARKVRRAVKALPPSRALPRQPDINFTPQQRKIVKVQTETAIRKFATQQGVHPQQAVKILQTSGGKLARQQLRLYTRAYHEDRALAFRAQTGKTTGSAVQDSKLLTAVNPRTIKPGPGPRGALGTAVDVVRSGGPLLYVNSKIGSGISNRFHSQLQSAGAGDIGGRLLQDAIDIPAQAIPSTIYAVNHPAAAAKGYVKSDPLALALQGKIKEAKQAVSEHPGVALVEVLSAGRAADNFAGLASRRGRAPGVRTTQQVPGTNIVNEVPLPKGYVAAKNARALDRKNAQRVQKLKDGARAEARVGNFDKARHLRNLAANEDRARLPEHEIKRRVNEFQAQGESRRRQDAAKVDQALPEFKHVGQEAATLVKAQGISHAKPSDLNAFLGELHHQHDHGGLTGPQKAANRELQVRLEQYLSGEHQDASVIDLKAKQYAAVTNPITEHLIGRGMLTTDSAKFVPFAVRQGFRHSAERLKTPEYIAHLRARGRPSREVQVYDARATRKALARRERRAVDRPFIHEHEITDFQKGSKYSGVLYHVTNPKTAELVERHGLNPAKAQRGTYGLGVYSASSPEAIPGATSTVKVAVRMRNPLVIENEKAMTALKPYRDAAVAKVGTKDLRMLSVEMTRGLQRKGYDGVVVKGAINGGDYVVNFHPQDVRVVSERTAARRGGRTSAVIERKLPPATVRANVPKPPKGSLYRKPGFAPPEIAKQLREAQRLRDEAKVAREAGDTKKASGLERQATVIRDRVERQPQPRLNGPELIDAVSKKMRDAGYAPEDIAFVTQKPGLNSAGAYFIDWSQRQSIGGPHRTGEATLKGAIPSHEGVLRENARRLQSLVSVDENFTAFHSEFGLRDPATGTAKTFRGAGTARDAAREMMFDADGNEIPGAYEWTPVRVNPWGGRQEQLQALLDDVNAEGLIEGVASKDGANPVLEAIQSALDTHSLPDDAPGEFALVPKAAVDQMLAHAKILNPSDGLKALRFLNTAFRKTVLATSVPWITGNIVEGLLRAGIERAGPGSYQRMKAVLEVMERTNPAGRAELDRRAFGGGQAGLVEKGSIYTAADQFRNSNPFLRKIALSAAVLRRTPGIKQMGDFYKAYTDWVFHSVNHSLEARIQMTIAGRKLFPDMGPVTKRAIEDAANGLTETNAQVQLARQVRRSYGQYDAFGTTNRQLIMLYTPFVAWQLNAVKFLGDVLPKDHPALTAAIAAAYSASRDWREQRGMSYFVNGAAPGFLQGSYPGRGGQLRVSRYTPFGIATDFPSNIAGAVLPQYHGSLAALSGLDWKGQKIKGADGKPETNPLKLMAISVQQFAYASVPIAAQVDRFLAGGGDPKALLDIVDPLKPVKNSSGNNGSGGGLPEFGSGGGSSGSSGGLPKFSG